MIRHSVLVLSLIAVVLISCVGQVHGACQTCLLPPPSPMAAAALGSTRHFPSPVPSSPLTSLLSPLGWILAKQAIMTVYQRGMLLQASGDKGGATNVTASEPMSSAMIGAIGFYKGWISPLLPPACRFLPTCSQYGVQAIQEFGPSKGSVLIAWRLLRCSPFGGRGYDPPKWPPVPYTYGSY